MSDLLETLVPVDAGQSLAELRKAAGKSQADVARARGIDTSRISRIETGEVRPSPADLEVILTYLDTDSARAYLAYLKRRFDVLPRPSFNHPDRGALSTAEDSLQRLNDFAESPNLPGPLVRQADMLRESLLRSAAYIGDLNHSFVYIGKLAVGKTTVVCVQTDLVLDPADKGGLDNKIVLEGGRGGITICEVRIRYNENFGLLVEPCPDAEVYALVDDLCAGIWEPRSADGDEERQERGVPREINRALRNMAGLTRPWPKKDGDGQAVRSDPAKELAKNFSRLDDFRAEFSSRLKLWQRKRREAWYELSAKETGPQWLRRLFTQVNNGRNAEFPLPKRVTVYAPSAALREHGYTLEIVDTKGVDRTAIRPDLQSCIEDQRTLIVLCSSFAGAPDVPLQGLIEHLQAGGADHALRERAVLLVLAHDAEALGMKDDSGALAETEEDGYAIKQEEVEAELGRLGVPNLPVLFFNAKTESAPILTFKLLGRLEVLRGIHVRQIESAAAAVNELIRNRHEQHALAAQTEVNKKLRVFTLQHQKLGPRKRPAYGAVINAIRTLHPSTVWATTRRSGSWGNLDVYFYLSNGAEADAKLRSDGALSGLKEIINNMLGDDELAPVHNFLRQLLTSVRVWRASFLAEVRNAGENTYRPALQDENILWAECEDLYGQGLVYRAEVADRVLAWFEHDDRDHDHQQLEARILAAWNAKVLSPLAELSKDFSAPSEGKHRQRSRRLARAGSARSSDPAKMTDLQTDRRPV